MPHNNIPHPEMVAKSEEVRQVLTPELYNYLLSLIPNPQRYGQLHERFEGSLTGFLKGEPDMVKECEAAREELNQAISVIIGVGKAVSAIDPKVLEKLGPLAHKTSSTSTALTAAKDLRVYFDKNGVPYCSVTRLVGAKGYEIWFCVGDPSMEASWKLLTWSTSCQKISLEGINRTVTNYLRLRGKRGTEVGPWSNLVILPSV